MTLLQVMAECDAAARSKFLAEHRHAEDEIGFFVAGWLLLSA